MREEWKVIKGFSKYLVSNRGRIKNIIELKDMTNYKFNGCTVLKRAENKERNVCWLCKCYCGKEFIVRATDIRTGNTKSCGCLNKKLAGDRARKHGNRSSRLYHIWNNMKMR